MKRVSLFIDSLGPGGAQRQIVGLAILLKKKGFDVKLATYFDLDFYKYALDNAGISYELIKGAASHIGRIWAVMKYYSRERYDWVIAYQETPSLILSLLKLFGFKFKLIVSERNTTQTFTLKDRIRFFLYRWADLIVPNSYAQEEILLSNYPQMKSKVITITNFVDLDYFDFYEYQSKGVPEIVIAASIWPPKNTLGFIEAVRIVKNRGLNIHFKWYGYSGSNKDYYDKAMSLIKAYHLEDYLELLPKTSNIKQAYRDCRYFCLPSFYEGTPNVIAEAMSTGRPILCSDISDNPRFVVNFENGFLFDPCDPVSIANAIEIATHLTEEEYKAMCLKSREIAKEMLSESVFINKYIEILNKC